MRKLEECCCCGSSWRRSHAAHFFSINAGNWFPSQDSCAHTREPRQSTGAQRARKSLSTRFLAPHTAVRSKNTAEATTSDPCCAKTCDFIPQTFRDFRSEPKRIDGNEVKIHTEHILWYVNEQHSADRVCGSSDAASRKCRMRICIHSSCLQPAKLVI